LHALTKSKISELPGFCPIEDWRSLHFSSVAGEF
jgi:hypothetical protein